MIVDWTTIKIRDQQRHFGASLSPGKDMVGRWLALHHPSSIHRNSLLDCWHRGTGILLRWSLIAFVWGLLSVGRVQMKKREAQSIHLRSCQRVLNSNQVGWPQQWRKNQVCYRRIIMPWSLYLTSAGSRSPHLSTRTNNYPIRLLTFYFFIFLSFLFFSFQFP